MSRALITGLVVVVLGGLAGTAVFPVDCALALSIPKPRPQNAEPVIAPTGAVFLEGDKPARNGKRFTGTTFWRTEMTPPARGAAPDVALRADVAIPEHGLKMSFVMRRNFDRSLPASHTIELSFRLSDFNPADIFSVPDILMVRSQEALGLPLEGLFVKVTSGFFFAGLSEDGDRRQRNMRMLRERGFLDIPIVYNNGRRGILTLEKGETGASAVEAALKAWGE